MTGAGLKIILVEDDDDMRAAVLQGLALAGHRTLSFSSGADALAALLSEPAGVLVSDIRMPGLDGRQLLRRVIAEDPDLPVILMTGHGDIAQAVEALREGAYDYLAKPFAVDRLLESVSRALEKRRLVLENRRLRDQVAANQPEAALPLTGNSPAIRRIAAMIGPIGATDVDVIIQGEAGSFKSEVARMLHAASARRAGSFISMDCDTLPEGLLEAQLFGDVSGPGQPRGAKRTGCLAAARGGTLHLGALEVLSRASQLRLLRLLESRGAPHSAARPAPDVRIMATTSADLARAVAEGSFRADLYFRLATVQLEIPPLRARPDDIPLLFARFASTAARKFQRPLPALTNQIIARLTAHDWPGNARELQHFAEQVVLGLDQARDVPLPASQSLPMRVARFEADLIRTALTAEQGDIPRTCIRLGLPRKTLYDKLARYQIRPAAFRDTL